MLKDNRSNRSSKINGQNYTDQLKALLDTASDLSSKLDLDKLLASIINRAVNLLEITGGELAIYDRSSKNLKIVASHNLGIDSVGTTLVHGEGAMGMVAETRKPMMIPDYQKWASRSVKYNKTTARCVMVVPLLSGVQLVGTLAAVHLDEDRLFDESDLELLNMFAPLAATAIENSRIYEAEKQRADEQKALLDTMRDLSSNLELNTLLTSVLQRAVKLLGVTGGELATFDKNDQELTVVASHNLGMDSVNTKLKIGEGAMGRVAKSQESLNILDYQTWEGRSDKYLKTTVRSVLVVPLMIGSQLVGTLAAVHRDEERSFSKHDLSLLYMFAPLAATAIENAQLFNRTRTLLKEAEQRAFELNQTKDQLIQQEKLASLGQLTAGIAHEIKNPLNFVNNFSEVSLELVEEAREEVKNETEKSLRQPAEGKDGTAGQGDDSEHANAPDSNLLLDILNDIEANLRKIHEHGSRANGIVQSMLLHSRGGSGKMEPSHLNPIIKEYVNLAYHGMRAGKEPINVDIDLQLDGSVGEVSMIAEDFSRVILNLTNNAFDAMREKQGSGHRPERSDDPDPSRRQGSEGYEPKLTVRTKSENGQIIIEIEDNGPGIPDEIKDKILQPFFTTKKGTQGTGLGLSITHDIIKAHGGSLGIYSKPGQTVFTIKLNG